MIYSSAKEKGELYLQHSRNVSEDGCEALKLNSENASKSYVKLCFMHHKWTGTTFFYHTGKQDASHLEDRSTCRRAVNRQPDSRADGP